MVGFCVGRCHLDLVGSDPWESAWRVAHGTPALLPAWESPASKHVRGGNHPGLWEAPSLTTGALSFLQELLLGLQVSTVLRELGVGTWVCFPCREFLPLPDALGGLAWGRGE